MRWRAPADPPALGSVAPRARENGSADARSAPRGDGEHAGVAISIRGLTHRYRTSEGTLAVLDDVDLDVAAGGYTAVTGPSGAGKSTLLSVLGGLEPLQVGTVAVGDTDLAGLRGDDLAAYRRSTVGFVFQHFGLLEAMTAAENVELAGTLAGLRAGERQRRAADLLEAVGLADRADHRPLQLSGGERQRVAIARALANRPRLLLADEPTGNLDEASAISVIELLERLRTAHGCTLVVVTHNRALGARPPQSVALDRGRRGARAGLARPRPPAPRRAYGPPQSDRRFAAITALCLWPTGPSCSLGGSCRLRCGASRLRRNSASSGAASSAPPARCPPAAGSGKRPRPPAESRCFHDLARCVRARSPGGAPAAGPGGADRAGGGAGIRVVLPPAHGVAPGRGTGARRARRRWSAGRHRGGRGGTRSHAGRRGRRRPGRATRPRRRRAGRDRRPARRADRGSPRRYRRGGRPARSRDADGRHRGHAPTRT